MDSASPKVLLGRLHKTAEKPQLPLKEPQPEKDAEELDAESATPVSQLPQRGQAQSSLSAAMALAGEFMRESTAIPESHQFIDAEDVRHGGDVPIALDAQKLVDPKVYAVKSLLGKGSFGAVYLVQHKETSKQYAMKILDKSKYTQQDMMSYALREKNVHMHIRHPCIVGLHHAFQTKTRLVMLLQYCPGGSLQGLLHSQRFLPEGLSQFYVAEVLLALGHLHRSHLVHRDVKPANVLLDEHRHALLTDFGLAKEENLDNPTHGLRSFAGTLHYLAPEVLRRTGHGRLVDVYNLGTLAFELLSGFVPFFTANKKEFYKNVKTAALRCPSYFSASAKAFVLETMAKEPEKRPGVVSTDDLQAHCWFKSINFDEVLQRKVEPPRLRERDSTPQARSRADTTPAKPFAPDQRPGLPELWVEDWDHTGKSYVSLQGPGTAGGAAVRGAACIFGPLQCLRGSARRH